MEKNIFLLSLIAPICQSEYQFQLHSACMTSIHLIALVISLSVAPSKKALIYMLEINFRGQIILVPNMEYILWMKNRERR
jgi:hypothetical protein